MKAVTRYGYSPRLVSRDQLPEEQLADKGRGAVTLTRCSTGPAGRAGESKEDVGPEDEADKWM